jgi:hypothetical protein
MATYTIRDANEARRFVQQGLWWQRVVPPGDGTVRAIGMGAGASVVFVNEGKDGPLAAERTLLHTLLSEGVAHRIVELLDAGPAMVGPRCGEWARRSSV